MHYLSWLDEMNEIVTIRIHFLKLLIANDKVMLSEKIINHDYFQHPEMGCIEHILEN